jgi:hypothetical protein
MQVLQGRSSPRQEQGIGIWRSRKFLNIGYAAYIQDTEGNVVGIWQSLRKPK